MKTRNEMQAAGQKRPWVRWFHVEDIPRRGQSRETRSRSAGCRGLGNDCRWAWGFFLG